MAKNNNKPLNLSVLKKLDATQYNNTKEIILSNDYTLQIDLKFRPSVIEEVVNKLQQIYKISQEDESLKTFPFDKFSMFLLMLHFTSLKNIHAKNISEEIQIMNMLIDQNLYKEILQHMEEHCGEEIKFFTQKTLEIMQDKLEALKTQQEFMNILNDEMEKSKLAEENKNDNVNEGDEFAESPTTIETDRTEITK